MSRFTTRTTVALAASCLVAAVVVGQSSTPRQINAFGDDFLLQNYPTSHTRPKLFADLETIAERNARIAGQRYDKQVADAALAYAVADTDEEREKAEGRLNEAVSGQFDLIVESREAQIAGLQKRLETLEKRLEERKAAKGEIVDLRIKVLINEAKGLGFYPGRSDASSKSRRAGMFDPFSAQLRPPTSAAQPEPESPADAGRTAR